MSLDREDIVRDDFPTVRRGYDPDAVKAHLRVVADALPERSSTPLAQTAAGRVGEIIEVAEKKAAEIEAEARSEAERIVKAAREEASEQVDRAQGAVNRLVEQADELRSAVGKLGADIASQVRSRAVSETEAPEPEIVPEPPRIPEPEPPREPEPQPPLTPEPQPPPSPEPGPAVVPEPRPPGPEMRAGSPSTEDLLAQLRGGGGPTEAASAEANGDQADAGGSLAASERGAEADVAAARLVAMKMALEGAPREEIERHLDDNYDLENADKLLDDVLARAKP